MISLYEFVCSIRSLGKIDNVDTLFEHNLSSFDCLYQPRIPTEVFILSLSLSLTPIHKMNNSHLQEVSTILDVLQMVYVKTLEHSQTDFDNNEVIIEAKSLNSALEDKLRRLLL